MIVESFNGGFSEVLTVITSVERNSINTFDRSSWRNEFRNGIRFAGYVLFGWGVGQTLRLVNSGNQDNILNLMAYATGRHLNVVRREET